MNNIKQIPYLGLGLTILAIVVIGSFFVSTYNRVVTLEENVNTSMSNISKEEKRRVDLFNNLVDAVENYRDFEQSTLVDITKARSEASSGNVDQAQLTIQAVAEAYPDLKSQKNYQQAMQEFSITENRIANNREQFNSDVREYNRKTRSFFTNMALTVMGYDKKDYKYLDYETKENEYRGLFSE